MTAQHVMETVYVKRVSCLFTRFTFNLNFLQINNLEYLLIIASGLLSVIMRDLANMAHEGPKWIVLSDHERLGQHGTRRSQVDCP